VLRAESEGKGWAAERLSGSAEAACYFAYQLARQRLFIGARQRHMAPGVEQQQGVVIFAKGLVTDIADQQRNVFLQAFGGAVLFQIF